MSGKILIVDDLVTNRIILKVKLNAACHEVLEAADGTQALELARKARPQLILLDVGLPGISGLEVCRQLRSEAVTRHIPIILISASSRRESRLEALAAGADEFLSKPLNETVLMARIRSLLRINQAEEELRQRVETCSAFGLSEPIVDFIQSGAIALVSADPGQLIGWRRDLSPHLEAGYRLMTPNEALEKASEENGPLLYVLAVNPVAPTAALRLIADLRARTGKRNSSICLAMDLSQHDMTALALDLGADDLVPLPVDPQETAIRLRMLLLRQRRAAAMRKTVAQGLQMAAIDPLTGLYNRRYALAQLDRISTQAALHQTPYAVLILDIDQFKQVNDIHGHDAGDQVLENLAGRLALALRPTDLLARIGGEEFLVALPDTGLEDAHRVAQRLCALVASQTIRLRGSPVDLRVTISAGLSVAMPGGLAQVSAGATGPTADARPEKLHPSAGAQQSLRTSAPKAAGSQRAADRLPVDAGHAHLGPVGEAAPDKPGGAQFGQARAAEAGRGTALGDLLHSRAGQQLSASRAATAEAGTASGHEGLAVSPPAAPGDFGARTARGTGETPAMQARRVLAQADAALLRSKARGRNQIQIGSAA